MPKNISTFQKEVLKRLVIKENHGDDYRLRKIAYHCLFKIELDHDVWNLKNENKVEIVHEPRRGNIATLENTKTESVWEIFSGG